jgi:hypothetical protein
LVVSIVEWIPCIIGCNSTTLTEISEDLMQIILMTSWMKAMTTTMMMIDSSFILLMIFVFFFIMNILYILFVWNMNLMSHIFYEFNVLNVWTSLLHYEEHYWCWESIGLCIKCFIQGEIFF